MSNNTVQVQKVSTFDLDTLELKRVEKNGKTYYNVVDGSGKFVYFQTSYLYNSFPVSDYKGNQKYSVQLNIDNDQYNQLEKLREKLLSLTFNNQEILKDTKKKIKSMDVLESIFQFPTSEREYQDNKYYNVKMSFNTNYENKDILNCDVLVQKEKVANKKVMADDFIKMLGSRNKALYVFKPYFWCVGGNLGCSLKVELVKLKKDSRDSAIQQDFSKLLLEDDE